MARGIYRGVNAVARKVTKEYRGVDGVARELKKEYRGVNGVARLCYLKGLFQFLGFTNTSSNGGYGEAVASKDGDSLYLSASGTAPSGVAIDAGYILADANGNAYTIPAGSTIIFTMRYEKAASYNLACMRLTDTDGNYSYPYTSVNVTDESFTITEDSKLMFLAETGFNGSESEYSHLWIDRFELNGEKIV